MAQTKKTNTKKSTTKKKTPSTTSKSTKRKKTATQSIPEPKPIRREVLGAVCFFIAIFSFIGYFKVDALFIVYFCGFIKGLIGWGYYIFPIALIVCSWTLVFSRGRPVVFKIVSALLAPIFLGALLHIFADEAYMITSSKMIKTLYNGGKEMVCGGLFSGVIAIGLKTAVSTIGAFIVFLFGLLFFSMNSVGVTLQSLIDSFRNRPKYEYEPRQERPVVKKPAHMRGRKPKQEKTASEQVSAPRKRRKVIDIPLDDEVNPPDENYKEEKVGFFNVNPRVKTPDQLLEEKENNEYLHDDVVDVQEYEMPIKENSTIIQENKKCVHDDISGDISKTDVSPTNNVEPLSVEEAAAVAGVSIAPMEKSERPIDKSTVTSVSSANLTKPSNSKKIASQEISHETDEIVKTIEQADNIDMSEYLYPPISLLNTTTRSGNEGRNEVKTNKERLESTIRSFGVDAHIVDVTRGPTVTRYDLALEQGVKLSKLTNLAGDIALSLGVSGVRIAPIPDKISTVGIEVPNKSISKVYLRDIIDSRTFKNAKSRLSFAIGEDIGGKAIVGNIAKLPHMLIAGTTGSGKSVCMNSLILSLLYKSTPEEVRLIMIDPKMVELGIYNGIPHLYVPVVTDPKKAAGALQWSVVEMLKRYRLFSEVGVRDIRGYNTYQKSIGEPTIPSVVIVIDELADLMLVASKEVEESVCRVAQMGRASGMHLIIATQRPSADVITGLMKANIPSRIAFAVSSAMESRIILDNSGAEKLIGAGDMLYSPIGSTKPLRVQGAFVTDEEREKVINFIKQSSEAEYSNEILEEIEKAAEGKSAKSDESNKKSNDPMSEFDELLPKAVDVIFETKQASVSMIQRKMKVGYARAARIVDQMEELGVVGPFEGSKPRKIMMTKQQWQEMQTAGDTAPEENSENEVDFSEYEDVPAEEWSDE